MQGESRDSEFLSQRIFLTRHWSQARGFAAEVDDDDMSGICIMLKERNNAVENIKVRNYDEGCSSRHRWGAFIYLKGREKSGIFGRDCVVTGTASLAVSANSKFVGGSKPRAKVQVTKVSPRRVANENGSIGRIGMAAPPVMSRHTQCVWGARAVDLVEALRL